MNSTFALGTNVHDLTLYQLQQKAQQLLQQNTILATQLQQLNRSQSLIQTAQYNPVQQALPTAPATAPTPPQYQKQMAHRSLSDAAPSSYHHHHHPHQNVQATQSLNSTVGTSTTSLRSPPPPGLSTSSAAAAVLAQLPQAPCISLQRRDSTRSDLSAADAQQQQQGSRYKTELCRPFEETGHCRYGAKCQFAHGHMELRGLNRHPRYKTEFCRTFHTTGFCSYGQRCNFIHNEDERRAVQQAQQQAAAASARPLHMPVTHTSSTGSSPASSVYGGDLSPTASHSPATLLSSAATSLDDPFSFCSLSVSQPQQQQFNPVSSRLSPAPSLSSFTSDLSHSSYPSPPASPSLFSGSSSSSGSVSDSDPFSFSMSGSEATTLSSAIELGLLTQAFSSKLNF